MSAPWLSVVIPTIGRSSLRSTLESWNHQTFSRGVELVVVADSHNRAPMDLARAADIVGEEMRGDLFGIRYRYLEHDAGFNCYGHPQRMEGARAAAASWVAFSQDDNVASAGSLEYIRSAIQRLDHPRPLFFKTRCYWGELVWSSKQLAIGNIDADCLVFPKALAERVTWGQRYEGDYDAALDAARQSAWDVGWHDNVIAIARPGPREFWWLS